MLICPMAYRTNCAYWFIAIIGEIVVNNYNRPPLIIRKKGSIAEIYCICVFLLSFVETSLGKAVFDRGIINKINAAIAKSTSNKRRAEIIFLYICSDTLFMQGDEVILITNKKLLYRVNLTNA